MDGTTVMNVHLKIWKRYYVITTMQNPSTDLHRRQDFWWTNLCLPWEFLSNFWPIWWVPLVIPIKGNQRNQSRTSFWTTKLKHYLFTRLTQFELNTRQTSWKQHYHLQIWPSIRPWFLITVDSYYNDAKSMTNRSKQILIDDLRLWPSSMTFDYDLRQCQ